ncbi:MAG: hypothetical protein JO295_10815 [Verrucomicrobia bacterium]|nr:hypothetical protein [Verrucomicrobiota bacterium]
MRSFLAEPFFRHWRDVPDSIQSLARKNYRLWKNDPRHPSLRFKQVKPNVWSVRVGLDYRVLGRVQGDAIHWFWIGGHDEYERLLRE